MNLPNSFLSSFLSFLNSFVSFLSSFLSNAQWLRDGLKIIESSAEVEALAKTVDSSDGCYMVPAFAGELVILERSISFCSLLEPSRIGAGPRC